MNTIAIGLAGVLLAALSCAPAAAWSHANRYGGASSGGGGSWSHSGFRGGSASGGGGSWSGEGFRGGTASGGDGSWNAHGAYGGSASGGGGSWSASNPYYGTSAYHSGDSTTVYHNTNYYGGYYPGYHPPTTVNYYGSGCYDCGGWNTAGAAAAGAAIGLTAGAAIASANTSAATSNAYAAGYAAGSSYAMGAIYTTLPAGCAYQSVAGASYYSCGGTWFSPSYGANGVFYRVVPAP